MRQVKILIPLVGISLGKTSIRLATEGFTGQSCQTAVEALQKALGQVTDSVLTPEYYVNADTQAEYVTDPGSPG